MAWWSGPRTTRERTAPVKDDASPDRAIAARLHAMSLTGAAAGPRLTAEADDLPTWDDADLVARFAATPRARMDEPPANPPRRRAWVRETLIGETAAIAAGAMSPARVAAAARHARFDTPPPAGRTVFPAWNAEMDPTARFAERAGRMVSQSDEMLMRRFGLMPGAGSPPSEPRDRLAWTLRALDAEMVRPMAGLPGPTTPPRTLCVDIADLRLDTGSGLAFRGDLVVDGERICLVRSPGDGVIEASEWSEGCGAEDVDALDLLIAATGEPRDDGGTPDSLAATLLDRVAMHVAVRAYEEAAAKAVLFHVEDGGVPALLQITLPKDGTRRGARSAMEVMRPDATCLDDMSPEAAATLWATLAA